MPSVRKHVSAAPATGRLGVTAAVYRNSSGATPGEVVPRPASLALLRSDVPVRP